jgi:hypothetical protein
VSLRTVERAAAPLRQALRAEARACLRFETAPGQQLQIDFWRRFPRQQLGSAESPRGTEGSNPLPSSEESANPRSLEDHPVSCQLFGRPCGWWSFRIENNIAAPVIVAIGVEARDFIATDGRATRRRRGERSTHCCWRCY